MFVAAESAVQNGDVKIRDVTARSPITGLPVRAERAVRHVANLVTQNVFVGLMHLLECAE